MDLIEAFENLGKDLGSIPKAELETARKMIEQGPVANGLFPSSLGAIQKASNMLLTPGVRPENLVSYLLSDPVMSVRLLSLVNHSFYNRGHEISSISRAVTHVGLMSLGKVLEDLAETKAFNAVFLGRATAAVELQKTILSSFVAKQIANVFSKDVNIHEKAATTAAVFGLTPLLLSYFKPNIHCGFYTDAEAVKHGKYSKILRRALGSPVTELAASLASNMNLPSIFANYMLLSDLPPWNRRSWGQKSAQETRMVVCSSYLGRMIADSLSVFENKNSFGKSVRDASKKLHIDYTEVEQYIAEAIVEYFQVTSEVGLKPFRLPSYIMNKTLKLTAETEWEEPSFTEPKLAERINPFLYELKASFNAERTIEEFRRFPQAVYCTFNALTRALPFERALLLMVNEERGWLSYASSFGSFEEDEKKFLKRAFNSQNAENMPDLKAYFERKPVFSGDPIFEGNWPFAAFPVIWHDEVVGVFYADRLEGPDERPLDTPEQVALIALAEQWHEVPPEFC